MYFKAGASAGRARRAVLRELARPPARCAARDPTICQSARKARAAPDILPARVRGQSVSARAAGDWLRASCGGEEARERICRWNPTQAARTRAVAPEFFS